jgi:hypothetical protein
MTKKTPKPKAKKSGRSSSPAARRARAVETFTCAGEAIGTIRKGVSVFAITRGEWSMIDAILWVLDQVGRSKLTVWTWTIAEYEVKMVVRLMNDERITGATLVIDHGARYKNSEIIDQWVARFGDGSIRYCLNHAKIATVESESGLRLLLRGSMNLNANPRFEQFDLTEGGRDFGVVRKVEESLPVLPRNFTGADAYAATGITDKDTLFGQSLLGSSGKVWAK